MTGKLSAEQNFARLGAPTSSLASAGDGVIFTLVDGPTGTSARLLLPCQQCHRLGLGSVPRIDAFLKSEAGLHLPRGNSLALQVAAFADETHIEFIWIIFMLGDGP